MLLFLVNRCTQITSLRPDRYLTFPCTLTRHKRLFVRSIGQRQTQFELVTPLSTRGVRGHQSRTWKFTRCVPHVFEFGRVESRSNRGAARLGIRVGSTRSRLERRNQSREEVEGRDRKIAKVGPGGTKSRVRGPIGRGEGEGEFLWVLQAGLTEHSIGVQGMGYRTTIMAPLPDDCGCSGETCCYHFQCSTATSSASCPTQFSRSSCTSILLTVHPPSSAYFLTKLVKLGNRVVGKVT